MTRKKDDAAAARLREQNPRSYGAGPNDGLVNDFRTTNGGTVSVTNGESYIVYVDGDKGFRVDKTIGGTSYVQCGSTAERDRAVRDIAGDHPVYDISDPNRQINPRA